jgi:hypothetical protein
MNLQDPVKEGGYFRFTFAPNESLCSEDREMALYRAS